MTIAPARLLVACLVAAGLVAGSTAVSAQTPPETEPSAGELPDDGGTGELAVEAYAPVATGDSHLVRDELSQLLSQHPYELPRVLALDPSLLANDAFLADYPQLRRFLAAHPEVVRNPRFFLAQYADDRHDGGPLLAIVEPISILSVMLILALSFAWLVRTLVDQKRWSRLSRTQSEVHTKILDRFGTSQELLEYMRTPAGSRFLESAPIPLHGEQPRSTGPVARVMWSVQIGIVVAAVAVGLLLVSMRVDEETAQALAALGTIGLCLGAGFVASAAVSVFLSRRLGLWPRAARPLDGAADEAGEAAGRALS